MLSPLALLICTIFVIFLLRVERKQLPEASYALWIPTTWMLLIASKPLGIWLQSGSATVEEGSSLDRAALSVFFCLGLIIVARRKFNWSNAIRDNIWLMLLIGYMLTSLLWSEMPFLSLKRWSRELIAIVMAFVVASERDPRKALESLFRRTIYILIPFSYILIHYFPEYGRLYTGGGELMWTGVTLHKNCLGQLCLFGIFFLIWSFIRRWKEQNITVVKYQTHIEAFLLMLSLYLMGGPRHSFVYSTTSNIALMTGMATLIGLYLMKKRDVIVGRNALLVMTALIIGYGSITPMLGGLSIVDVSSSFGRDTTLTGRTDIWAILLRLALQKPLLGHGFGGFWTTESRELSTVSQAHNGYLDVILNIGFVGLLVVAIFVLSCMWMAHRAMKQYFDWGTLMCGYVIIVVVHNIAETSIASFENFLMAVLMFFVVCFSYPVCQLQDNTWAPKGMSGALLHGVDSKQI